MYREDASEDRSVLVVAFRGQVFGLDPTSGTIAWEHRIAHEVGEVEIAMHGARVYACGGHRLACIAYPSGQLIGEVSLGMTYRGRPTMVVERGRLFVASSGEVACFDFDGRPLWTQPFTGKGLGGVALGFPGNVRQADDAGSQ